MRNKKNRARRQAQLVEAALQAGRSVVVDNTNPTVEERASLIELGKLYNAQILGYYFQSKASDCLERNQKRTGKARVTDVGIFATAKKLVPPTYAEGFHQLFYVKMTENSAFEVRAWTETDVVTVPLRRS
jgi:predicted kinase